MLVEPSPLVATALARKCTWSQHEDRIDDRRLRDYGRHRSAPVDLVSPSGSRGWPDRSGGREVTDGPQAQHKLCVDLAVVPLGAVQRSRGATIGRHSNDARRSLPDPAQSSSTSWDRIQLLGRSARRVSQLHRADSRRPDRSSWLGRLRHRRVRVAGRSAEETRNRVRRYLRRRPCWWTPSSDPAGGPAVATHDRPASAAGLAAITA